jgi:hypothetical protein
VNWFFIRLFVVLVGLLALTGCVQTPISQTMVEAFGKGKSSNIDTIKLDPKLKYLRVTVRDRSVLMVLGYLDNTPQGKIETWYSSEGEVLSLLNGRILSTNGLELDWRNVKYASLPGWSLLAGLSSNSSSFQFSRTHDQMPAYKFGISEVVNLYGIGAPSNSNLIGLHASQLKWFEEKVKGTSHGLPSARYGLSTKDVQAVVVYGEQCFSSELCFSWQTWPVVK